MTNGGIENPRPTNKPTVWNRVIFNLNNSLQSNIFEYGSTRVRTPRDIGIPQPTSRSRLHIELALTKTVLGTAS
jgi:hypothetical protein